MIAYSARPPEDWQQDLVQLGFARDGEALFWQRNGTTFQTDGRWSSLCRKCEPADLDPLHGQLGKPGLWKLITGHTGTPSHWAFDLPPGLFAERRDDDPMNDPQSAPLLQAGLEWSLATADGKIPDNWQPPPRDEVESWLPPFGLTVQRGKYVRQGTLQWGANMLALRFPIVAQVPADLPAARLAWLREVLLDGQSRTRMARVGFTESGSVEAEVDLRGAPHAVLEHLLITGLESLRWLVQWLEPADFLARAEAACRAVEVCPARV